MEDINLKLEKLKEYLKSLGKVAVAFSGGVDSTFLLKIAYEVLGDNVLAVTLKSDVFSKRETAWTREFCKKERIPHLLCEFDPFNVEGFKENPVDRCYICKKALFTRMIQVAGNRGIKYIAEGSNVDDMGDYRPGLKAVRELEILSPLQMAGLSKAEIRQLSKMYGISTWNKPSKACLASRFVYGEEITKTKLEMAEKAEQVLIHFGYEQSRVRIHGNIARIELLPEQIQEFVLNHRKEVYQSLKEIGFDYITLDLEGYRMGSMNETIAKEQGDGN